MAGLGMVLGGALSGFGAGLAQQGQMDFQQRRDMALENLRNQNKQTEIAVQGNENRKTEMVEADLTDRNNARQNARTTSSTMAIDKNKNSLDTAKAERLARLEAELGRTNAAAAEALKRETAAGEVSDTFQDEQGNWYVLYKNGQQKSLNVKGALKAPAGGASGNILDRAGGASGTKPATPGAKVSISNW